MSTNSLKGKIALVTGAGQGIGKETAILLAREGATVIVTDIIESLGASVAKEIGGDCQYLHLDVSREEDWKLVMSTVMERFGKLNILVNNAAITGRQEGFGPQDPENISFENWKKINAVNSDGTFLGCKYAIQIMKLSADGSIINISSRAGLVGFPEASAYAASKAAVRNLTKSVALYCCHQGYPIRCNSIRPGFILTPIWEFATLGTGIMGEMVMAKINATIPMQKMGSAEDVANAVLFLASDKSKYITGSELSVDGGLAGR